MIRVLICDGMSLKSSLIAAILSHEPDMWVVGSASTVRDSLRHIPQCDVLLIGNSLPRTDALAVAIAAASTTPHVKTIAVGYRALEPLLTELLKAGATGYVLQDASVADLLSTIRVLNLGKRSDCTREATNLPRTTVRERTDLTARQRTRAA